MFDKNYKNGSSCFSEGELVSYLYGEAAESVRNDIELHLSSCSTCTDEFAGLSDARFSVYEWQKIEFARLATPQIAGPWEKQPIREIKPAIVEAGSWIQGLFAAFRRPAFAFTVIPILILVAVVMSVYLGRSTEKNVGIAEDTQASAVQPPNQSVAPQVAQVPDVSSKDVESRIAAKESDKIKVTAKYAKATRVPSAQQIIKNEVASTGVTSRRSSANRRAPRLSDFEEEDDSSIRLADLLAETDREK